jgi:nicotinamide mononucleotide transporter
VSWIEIVASILGVANIVLLVRRSIWNYPFGIVMVTMYGVVFFQARLFSDALLQVFFFVVQIYGWWVWYHARDSAGLVKVEVMSASSRLIWLGVIVAATATEGWYLAHYTSDSAPWMDANTTAMSVVAQYLLSIRKIENWILWIVTDVVQIGLYYWKGLYPTTGLYILFLILSSVGLYEWLREWRAHRLSAWTGVDREGDAGARTRCALRQRCRTRIRPPLLRNLRQ